VLVCAAAIGSGCSASYPTSPTSPVAVGLQLQLVQPMGEVPVGSLGAFSAFAIRSDGAWEDVTSKTTWSSPDPLVFRSLGQGRFFADSLGRSGVRAQYEGLAEFVDIVVIDPARRPTPRLNLTMAAPNAVGASAQATAVFLPAVGGSIDVTAATAWASSDPRVAVVDRGRLTAMGVGTTRITASYADVTSYYLFSIRPPQQ